MYTFLNLIFHLINNNEKEIVLIINVMIYHLDMS